MYVFVQISSIKLLYHGFVGLRKKASFSMSIGIAGSMLSPYKLKHAIKTGIKVCRELDVEAERERMNNSSSLLTCSSGLIMIKLMCICQDPQNTSCPSGPAHVVNLNLSQHACTENT